MTCAQESLQSRDSLKIRDHITVVNTVIVTTEQRLLRDLSPLYIRKDYPRKDDGSIHWTQFRELVRLGLKEMDISLVRPEY